MTTEREPDGERAGLPASYWRACRLAEQGQYDDARRLYAEVEDAAGESDTRLRALVRDDLAVLEAMEGRYEEARRGWQAAREVDRDCLQARLNDALVAAELDWLNRGPGDVPARLELAPAPALWNAPASVPIPPPRADSEPIKVAVLSFLFNWPSTGGGNVHTVELVRFLGRAGYDVHHIYARYPEWGIGTVTEELPYPSEALEFGPAEWRLEEVLARYRRAVDRFDPDCAIITDSWNMKPLLAEAVLGSSEDRHFASVDRGLSGFKARQNLAVVAGDLGDLAEAEEHWRRIVAEVPRYRPGWRGLGEVLVRRGRFAEAEAIADELVNGSETCVEGFFIRGRLALARGRVDEALAELDRAAAEAPDDVEVLGRRCQLVYEHGSPEDAEQALKRLIDRDPNDPSAYYNLGTLLLRARRSEEAARAYRQSLRFRTNHPATYLNLGCALKDSGRIEEAVTAWEHALRLAPGDPMVRDELARVGRTPLATGRSFQGAK